MATTNLLSLDREQVRVIKSHAVRERPYFERISLSLAFRLLDSSDPYFDAFSVLDELDFLEGLRPCSRTKPEQQFDHQPLFPFWHKHFFSARHLIKNIAVRWNLDRGGNKDLTVMLNEVAAEHGKDPDLWPGYLAHKLVVEGTEARVQRGLTGDWIIFAKHCGQNFYLDLATHSEGLSENAQRLLERLRNGSRAEFPFLFEPAA